MENFEHITPDEAYQRLRQGDAVLVDIRDP